MHSNIKSHTNSENIRSDLENLEISSERYENFDEIYEELEYDESETSTWEDFKDWYFEPRGFEKWNDGIIYRAMGVDIVKQLNPNRGPYLAKAVEKLGYDIERPVKDAETKEEGLKDWLPETRFNEKFHAPQTPPAAALTAANPEDPVFWTLLLVNGYSTMVNRYNRARIHNHLEEHDEDF
jgi:hypothetical protein